MGNRNYPKIDSRDMELFQRINKHGFVDMYYIYKFYKTDCKPRTVTDRINQLIHHRYLFEKKTFIPPEYSSTNMKAYKIIGLGVMAQRLLDGAGVIVHDYNSILKNASPYRMYHQVQLTTVCDTIQLGYKNGNSNFELFQILNEKESYLESVGNMPDAALLFRQKNGSPGCVIVFVELERSYASMERISSKMINYFFSFSNNDYGKMWGLPIISYRVLYVAQTNSQYNVLKEKITLSDNHKEMNVLITRYSDIISHPLEDIYYDFNADQQIKLLGNMAN